MALVCGAINLPSVSAWTVLVEQTQHCLNSPRRLRAFIVLMAVPLVASLYPVLHD